MAHGLDQQALALGILEEVVLQVRIAVDDPDVAQHLEQHARGATGAPLAAQLGEELPHVVAQQADHDLAIRERRVVVGDLAQARGAGDLLVDEGVGDGVHCR